MKSTQEQNKNQIKILEQQYLTAKDLQILIPDMTYQNALQYIKRIHKQMEEKNYYIPHQRTLVALTKLVKKDLGL